MDTEYVCFEMKTEILVVNWLQHIIRTSEIKC